MSEFPKINIVAVSSCFGLGPVGKLAAIIKRSENDFNWFATGEQFDFSVFDKNIFIDTCWSMDKDTVAEFIQKYQIRIALVVLKNKMARLLTELGVKVVYVDSLPFMWTPKDAAEGKIPYNVAYYCAQKTLKLSDVSEKLFSKVENLLWVNPIVNKCKSVAIKDNYVLINLGGMHSPHGTNNDYLQLVIKPLIEVLKTSNKEIIITCGKNAQSDVKLIVGESAKVTTFSQDTFIKKVFSASLFFTAPGMTTIVEILQGNIPTILLPPQNLSQFYNIEYAKTVISRYKCIDWLTEKLSLDYFSRIADLDEGELVKKIYQSIQTENTLDNQLKYQKHIETVLASDYNINLENDSNNLNGVDQIADLLNTVKAHIIQEGGC